MGTSFSHESSALLKILKDGRWHNYDEVMEKLRGMVAPGRAVRTFQNRDSTHRVSGPPPEDRQMEIGRRMLANSAMKGLTRNHLEFRGLNHLKEVRRRPTPGRMAVEVPPELELEVPPPHLVDVVVGAEEPEPPVAVEVAESVAEPSVEVQAPEFTNEEFRAFLADVVREVVQDELKLFSYVLRDWLGKRFVAVEDLVADLPQRIGSVVKSELSRFRSPLGLPAPDTSDRPWKKPRK